MADKLVKMNHPYHYTESGLRNIWLFGIYQDEDGDPVIPNLSQLHEEIAKGLALQKKRLTGAELRFLRSHIGFSGADLARKVIKVSPETVSRWENDKQVMDESTELLLRMLVLKKIHFDDYEVDELAEFNGKKRVKLEARFSARGKIWDIAA